MHKSLKFSGFGRVWTAMIDLEDRCRDAANSGGDQASHDAALYRRDRLWLEIVRVVNKAGKTTRRSRA